MILNEIWIYMFNIILILCIFCVFNLFEMLNKILDFEFNVFILYFNYRIECGLIL